MLRYKEYRSIKEGSLLERESEYYLVLGVLQGYNHLVLLEYSSKNISIIRLLDLIHEFKYIDELDKDLDKIVLKLKLSLTNDSFLFILNNLSKVTKYPLLKEYKEIENLKGYCGYIAPNGDLLTTNNIDMLYGNLDCLVSVDLYNLKIQNKITDNLLVTKGRGL